MAIFGKASKGHEIKKKLQDHFTKMRGKGEKPFKTFPKIHPFWWRLVLSLKRLWKYRCSAPQKFKATNASSAALEQLGRVSLIFSPLKSVDLNLKTQISDTVYALVLCFSQYKGVVKCPHSCLLLLPSYKLG